MQFTSKLPDVSTTIFTVMSTMAHEHDAINLAQGFPGFEIDATLKRLANQAMQDGYNQYAPMPGIFSLRKKLTEKINTLYGSDYHPETDITITAGATQAIYTVIATFIHPDDEVIVFKPAYDCYEPAIELHGGKVIPIQMEAPDYKVDWSEVKKAMTSKTKMVIINSPHNPTGTILSEQDMLQLETLLTGTDIILLSDEVYEHIIFDNEPHQSVARFPELRARSFITASFGKTFHVTGWKMGYAVAPKELMEEFRKVHQFNVFSLNHPTQKAFATYLETPSHYLELGEFYQKKRDLFLGALQGSRFKMQPSAGTYFQMLDYSQISDMGDIAFAKALTTKHKIASIPTSVFNLNQKDYKMLRFCFAKDDDVLLKAAEILNIL